MKKLFSLAAALVAMAMTACFTSCGSDDDDDPVSQSQSAIVVSFILNDELKNNIDFSEGITFTTPDGKTVKKDVTFTETTTQYGPAYKCVEGYAGKPGSYTVQVNAKAKSPITISGEDADYIFGYGVGTGTSSDGGKNFSNLNLSISTVSGNGLSKSRFEARVQSVVAELNTLETKVLK